MWTRSPGASARISLSARLNRRPLLKEHSRTLAQASTDYPATDPCAAGRELTDDREELVRLVERVMHLAAGSTQEEDDAVDEVATSSPTSRRNRSHFYPERTEASLEL